MTTSSADARNDPMNAHLPLLNQPQTILGTTITFLSLAILAASLRLWIRFRDRLWGWDDAFVFLAGITSVVGDSIVCLMPYDGLGLHFQTLSLIDMETYFKHVWSTNIVYCASTTLIKLAILFQYMRLFAESTTSVTSSQYHLARKCVWTAIVVIGMWGISFFLLAVFPCQPIAKNWNPYMKGKCVGWGTKDPSSFFSMWIAHNATNMVLDLVVLLLPLPFLGMLNLGCKSRVGLIVLFTMGGVVTALSMGRMIALCLHSNDTEEKLDVSYRTPVVYIFSVLEVNIAILCASIPIFWPMISSFAANKILVVNEIVVHIESYPKTSMDGQSGIGLADQAAFKSPPESPGANTRHTPSRISTIAHSFDRQPSRDSHVKAARRSKDSIGSVVVKTFTRTETQRTARPSQESQRNLYPATSQETGSLNKSDYDWFAELDRDCVGKRTTTRIETGQSPFQSPVVG